MTREDILKLLAAFQEREISAEEVAGKLVVQPFEDIGHAKVDLHRQLRKGFPEVILGSGKTVEQISTIAQTLHQSGQAVLITRISQDVFDVLHKELLFLEYHSAARCATWSPDEKKTGRGFILVISAGTSDIPVAEEAAVTAEMMGNVVHRIYDVGVAGLHRLVRYVDKIRGAEVIIAVAGMEGALPSVISGLTDRPVIGVPTSVGYGAHFNGVASLLSMLNSCGSGVTVVNIDNGFGAGYAASLINRRRSVPGSAE